MKQRQRCTLFALAAMFLWSSATMAAVSSQFVGSVGCKSSYCHGGGGEKQGQYLTWVRQDFHTQAYAILVTARSSQMAATLKSPENAPASRRCLVCHSPMRAAVGAEPHDLTNKGDLDDGVSCENCHGAAKSWLRGHTRRDWTYPMRVGAGMRDLRNLYVRANACVACHQNIDLDLREAGHPALAFELDGQSVNEPRHWREQDPWNGLRPWLIGQAIALREVSWALNRRDGADPELVAQWGALVWLLRETGLSELPAPAENPGSAEALQMQQSADALARAAGSRSLDQASAIHLLQTMVGMRSEFENAASISPKLAYQRALRLVLALACFERAAYHESPPADLPNALQALQEDVRIEANFELAKFNSDLATFGGTIKVAPD